MLAMNLLFRCLFSAISVIHSFNSASLLFRPILKMHTSKETRHIVEMPRASLSHPQYVTHG